jgi:hypothetical protein
MRVGLFGVSIVLLFTSAGVATGQQPAAPWFVTLKLVSGPASCIQSMTRAVREEGSTFTFLDDKGQSSIWTVAVAGDGSVAPVETKGGNQRLKVTVPAGKGPRAFEVMNLGNGCVWKAEPR